MPMVPFYSKFPELAVKETRTAFLKNHPELPDGEFYFADLYCDEDGCDCRRVLVNVMSPATKDKVWATINFGWEPVGFYRKWVGCDAAEAKQHKGPSLDPLNPQTEYSRAFLKLFREVIRDREYVERFKRHYRLFKSKLWTIEGILNEIELNRGYFAEAAVNLAIARREAITPFLLGILDRARKEAGDLSKKPDYMAPLYAIHLLAQFREIKAYPLLVDFLHLPGEIVEDMLGDTVTEGLCRILASVCGGDIAPIQGLVEDSKTNEWVRGAAVRSLNVLLFQGLVTRSVLVDYYRRLLCGGLEREHSEVWNMLVSAVVDIHPRELLPEITKAYEDGLVDDGYIGLDDVEEAAEEDVEWWLSNSKREKYAQGMIDDTVAEMGWWACFPREETAVPARRPAIQPSVSPPPAPKPIKVSPNDYCPCGSEKKYKKCCGKPSA